MDNRAFFNQIAHKWDQIAIHSEEKLAKIIELSNIPDKADILDVGTGTGVLVRHLLPKDPGSITAIDIAENMIALAKTKYDDARVCFVAGDVLEYREGSFDVIFLYSVYPHFEDKKKLFIHLAQLLKPAGKVIIAHSAGKEKINELHSKSGAVKEHALPGAEITAELMKDLFEVTNMIDTSELYYISAIKK